LAIPYFRPNTIYCGDCKEVMAKFPNECVDLIYADPPFFSNKSYEVLWEDGYEKRAFEDRWKGGIENYVLWMKEKLEHCYRVIKKTGSMYLHCDWHAVHHLRGYWCVIGHGFLKFVFTFDMYNLSARYKSKGKHLGSQRGVRYQ